MKPFRESPALTGDLQQAYDHYLRYSPATADRFLTSYQKAVDILAAHPWIVRARRHGWRQLSIPRFPVYAIFYKELEPCWLVAGLLPCVRDPDALHASLLIREVQAPTA